MMTETTIDLLPFCSEGIERMQFPFVQSGKRYATDGKIIVEVDANGEPDTPSTGDKIIDPPSAKRMYEMLWNGSLVFTPWPEPATIIGTVDCPVCCDAICNKCRGEGIIVCDLMHYHDCKKCDGEGVIRSKKCKCKGLGTIKGPARQQIGSKQIDIKYDRLIRALPGPVTMAINGDAVLFQFNGGRGIVMTFSDCIESEE